MVEYTNVLFLAIVHIRDEFDIHSHFRMEILSMTPILSEIAVMLCYSTEQQNEHENGSRASDKQYLFSFHLQHQNEMYISSLLAYCGQQC